MSRVPARTDGLSAAAGGAAPTPLDPRAVVGGHNVSNAPEASARILDAAPLMPIKFGHLGRPPSAPVQSTADSSVADAPVETQSLLKKAEHSNSAQHILGGESAQTRNNLDGTVTAVKRRNQQVNFNPLRVVGGQGHDPARFASRDDMLLKIQWPMHLGFNNLRFQLEVVIYLAVLLKRKLLAPARLRMRDCLDQSQCESSRCTQGMDDAWWCPTDLFLDPEILKFAGGVILVQPDDDSIEVGRKTVVIEHAFDRMYAENAVWVERLPYQMRRLIGPNHEHPANSTFQLHYQVGVYLIMCNVASANEPCRCS
jgi:hypothetical protein